MPQNYETVDESKRENPMLGLIGFIVFVVVGGLSFAVSGLVANWLKSTTVVLGASGIKVLPMTFPPEWGATGEQLAVTAALFMVVFVIVMVLMFMFMRPKSEDDMSVSMNTMRKEAAARKKRR